MEKKVNTKVYFTKFEASTFLDILVIGVVWLKCLIFVQSKGPCFLVANDCRDPSLDKIFILS